MTDRINAFVVVLENDLHAEYIENIVTALTQIKGVLSVEPHTSTPIDVEVATARRDTVWTDALIELVHNVKTPSDFRFYRRKGK